MVLVLKSGERMTVDPAEHIAMVGGTGCPQGEQVPKDKLEYERALFAQRGTWVVNGKGQSDQVVDIE